jgi:hypothetical protein
MYTKVIGIDLSLRGTAICVMWGDGPVLKHRTQMIRGKEAKNTESRIERLDEVSSEILKIASQEIGERGNVIIEGAARNQAFRAAEIGEMHGSVKLTLYRELSIISVVEEATKIRKAVVGKIPRKTIEIEITKGKNKGKKKKKVSYGEIVGKGGKVKVATVKDAIEEILKARGYLFETQDEMDAWVTAKYLYDKIQDENKNEGHK